MIISIEDGLAVCTAEPRGDYGLEGYQSGNTYVYRKVKDDSSDAAPYYRIFPLRADEKPLIGEAKSSYQDYYETCSETVFNRYFEKETL